MIAHTEVIPNHMTDALTEALPSTITPAPIITTVTHHTGNLYHIEAYQPTPEIAADPEHACNTNLVRTPHLNLHPDLVGQQYNHRISGKRESQWMSHSKICTVWITPLEQGGPPVEDSITVAHIVDCPMIMVHAHKCYKALIDSGADISLLWYSTYKNIGDSYKTPIQPTTAKLNTADGSPMTALGMTALHLRIVGIQIHPQFCNL